MEQLEKGQVKSLIKALELVDILSRNQAPMTLQELQDVFVEQGCRIAYNLDGGGSATMVLEGERVNRGSTSRERSVSDIVYFTR